MSAIAENSFEAWQRHAAHSERSIGLASYRSSKCSGAPTVQEGAACTYCGYRQDRPVIPIRYIGDPSAAQFG